MQETNNDQCQVHLKVINLKSNKSCLLNPSNKEKKKKESKQRGQGLNHKNLWSRKAKHDHPNKLCECNSTKQNRKGTSELSTITMKRKASQKNYLTFSLCSYHKDRHHLLHLFFFQEKQINSQAIRGATQFAKMKTTTSPKLPPLILSKRNSLH